MKQNQNWSDTKPTEPGKYHMRERGSNKPSLVNVSRIGGELLARHPVFMSRIRLSAECFNGTQWRKVE